MTLHESIVPSSIKYMVRAATAKEAIAHEVVSPTGSAHPDDEKLKVVRIEARPAPEVGDSWWAVRIRYARSAVE